MKMPFCVVNSELSEAADLASLVVNYPAPDYMAPNQLPGQLPCLFLRPDTQKRTMHGDLTPHYPSGLPGDKYPLLRLAPIPFGSSYVRKSRRIGDKCPSVRTMFTDLLV